MTYITIDFISKKKQQKNIEQYYHILTYYYAMKKQMYNQYKIDNNLDTLLKRFWNKEINFEQRLYGRLKNWEKRHPIMGIIICTVLLGILISLIAGIILEAVY